MKKLQATNAPAYIVLLSVDKEIKFYAIENSNEEEVRCWYYKTFYFRNLLMFAKS